MNDQSNAPISFEELLARNAAPAAAPASGAVVEPQAQPVPESQPQPEQVAPGIQNAASFAELAEQFGIDLEVQAVAVEQVEPDAVEETGQLEFENSPNLIREPQTNSIVLDVTDPILAGEIITDSGEVVRTGSIELPILTNTGSIPIIALNEDRSVDDILSAEFADNYVTSIAPIRASGVMNSRARESVLPLKTRRGESQTVLLAVTSILMITVGVLVLAAWMLGVFNQPLGTN